MTGSIRDLVLPHVDRPDLADRMAAFHADLDRAIAAHAPVCRNRGLCCRFNGFGHRLYVTTVELVYFVRGRRAAWRTASDGDACPYQVRGECRARPHRPMGCRVFHCQTGTERWQAAEYERHLATLKTISAEFGVAYRYVEWLSALQEIGRPPGAVAAPAAEEGMASGGGIDPRHLPVIG